ncbi:fatty-acid amide hydrolase 2-A [Solenopsis invicta]|uniref:fatty-acid amide hydrolase 2-A n=1 Tax=Solenopsis invicta TaxID=13686 RepID=UPI00193E4339|nr:fatty-acid amide hydrolase 2-A [Solenopsis invicta]XP_039314221.1 fatty-acid amide hydrolase 2-A [Solenopsis invicta]XP_039314222.1 fatty-acid amide hydrolase 2-A [Solenopsis invicta]
MLVEIIIKYALFLLRCLLGPFYKLQSLKKRRRCPPIVDRILLLSATEIAQKIRKKEISSEEVITAYVKRCKEVNPLINAIVEDRFDVAIQEAREIDNFLQSTIIDEEKIASEKPLLGLPVTIKESIAVQGMSYTVGVKDDPSKATKDADVVARIRKAGGIPLLVSNTPELCMWWHTFNKVTGTTRNPYDTRKSPGGSSGGEAALVGSGASILSLVSDIGGSARLPALFCGVFGHKPTPTWISVEGHKPGSSDKNWPLFFAIGSMVRYATDLPLLLSVMSQSDEAKITFNRKVCLKDMRFFYMDNYGPMPPSMTADVKNSIYKLVQYLETIGIKVQHVNLESMKWSFRLSCIMLLRIKGVYSMFNRSDNPKKSKKVLTETLKYLFCMSPHSFPAIFYGITKTIADSFPESTYKKMMALRTRLKKQFEELLGNDGVLICPSFSSSAIYPQESVYNINNCPYMMIFNVLGFPVTQCPLGFDKNQMPIGLQIAANPGCDHLTIAVAQEIERTFGGWRAPQDKKIHL